VQTSVSALLYQEVCTFTGFSLAVVLRADREVVLAAVEKDSRALAHASYELRADQDVEFAVVARNGDALVHASAELCADRDVVLAAVAQNGRALQYASEELRADRAVVLAAVAQNGRALEYASAVLQADREVVLASQDSLAEMRRRQTTLPVFAPNIASILMQQHWPLDMGAGRHCLLP
jgi:predicted O-methyltransferase YrrM